MQRTTRISPQGTPSAPRFFFVFFWRRNSCATAVRYPPTAVGYSPASVGYLPTAVGYLPTVVGYPPTAVGYPPTAVGYPRTAVGYPPTATAQFCFFTTRECSAPSARPARTQTMSLLPRCLARPSDVGEGHVVITNGTSLAFATDVIAELQGTARRPVTRLTLDARYFPGETVPARVAHADLPQRVRRLAELATAASRTGRIPVIDLHDPWHAAAHPLASALSRGHRVTTALLHLPLERLVPGRTHRAPREELQARVGAVLEHCLLYEGTPGRTPTSVEYVSRKVWPCRWRGVGLGGGCGSFCERTPRQAKGWTCKS